MPPLPENQPDVPADAEKKFGSDTTAITPETAASSPGSESSAYLVQVHSFSDRQSANDALARLTQLGHAAKVAESKVAGKIWYRVQIGDKLTLATAQGIRDELIKQGYTGILILKKQPMNKSLENILKRKFGLSDEDYADAVRLQKEKGGTLAEVLLRRKVLDETQLLEALSQQYDLPFWPELPLESFGEDRARNVPIAFLKRHVMVPLVLKTNPAAGQPTLPEDMINIIAVNDPAVFQPLDDLSRMIGFGVYNLVLSTKSAIFAAINLLFDMSQGTAQQLVQNMEEDGSTIISEIEDSADLLEDTSDAPIIKLVNHIISQSIKARASDIHIEPYQDSFKVRYRVDGILYDLLTPPKWIQAALISRIKVMAKLNIAEKRLPQDGRLEVKIGSQSIDVRVSTLPTTFGERVVLRLLNKSGEILNLKEIGLPPEDFELLDRLMTQPNGIILVTGPTGSGENDNPVLHLIRHHQSGNQYHHHRGPG